MSAAPKLKRFNVSLHRRGGKTRGRIEVLATCPSHAHRVAVRQTIAVSYPNTKRSQWIVTSVEPMAEVAP